MEKWKNRAMEIGFTRTGLAKVDKLKLSTAPEIRALCEANACGRFGRSWVCPPAVGSVEECVLRLTGYGDAFVVQLVGEVEDSFDFEGAQRIQDDFTEKLRALRDEFIQAHEDALALGAGSCSLCEKCTWPDAQCVYPEKALASVESHGINVMLLCKRASLPYHSGKDTVTFTGAILFTEKI